MLPEPDSGAKRMRAKQLNSKLRASHSKQERAAATRPLSDSLRCWQPGQLLLNPARVWPLIFCLVGLWFAVSGCRQEPRADIVILNGAEPESLDPALFTAQADLRLSGALFEGLARTDPVTGSAIPSWAERWEISPDGKIYTFYLRTNAQWSTGAPITAEDFVYSWRRVLDPATAGDYASQLFPIKNAEAFNRGEIKDPTQIGVKALSPQVLRVELARPTAFFIELCAFPTLAAVPRQAIEKHGDQWLSVFPVPVSGPYLLEAWHINDKVRLRKNPRYWDAAHTQNEVVDVLPVGSASAAINLYETGAADIVWDKELIPAEMIDVLIQRPDFHLFDYLATYFIRINTTRPPFDRPGVRRALAMAIDKHRIVDKITKAQERVASQITPPGIPGYEPPAGLPYDPERARQELAAAGFPGGKGFPAFQYMFNASSGGSSKTHQKIGVELQQMWKQELGIQMELRQVESKIHLAAQSALDYDACRSSWVGDYNDPCTFLDLFLSNNGNNRTGWKNRRYDDLLNDANNQLDTTRRAALLRQAETLLTQEELPVIPLFFYKGICYYDTNRITGIYPNLIDQHPINFIRRINRAKP